MPISRHRPPATPIRHGRDSRAGFVLLATLVAVTLLATLAGWVQIRSFANQRLAAGLAADLRQSLAADAVYDRLRGLVADQMQANQPRTDRPPLDGGAFELRQDGYAWQVKVQDTQGLIDVYVTDPSILAAALPDADQFRLTRDAALAGLPPGGRFLPLAMSMARFGLSPQEADLFTQSNTNSLIRLDTAPPELRTRIGTLPPHLVADDQTTTVRISFAPASNAEK